MLEKFANRDWGYLQSMKPELGVPKIDETEKKKMQTVAYGKKRVIQLESGKIP